MLQAKKEVRQAPRRTSFTELFYYTDKQSSAQQLTDKNSEIGRVSGCFVVSTDRRQVERSGVSKAEPETPPLCAGCIPLLDKGIHYGNNRGQK